MTPHQKCIDERGLYTREIQNRLNGRKLQIHECKVIEVKTLDVSLGNTKSSGTILDKGNASSLENDYSKTGNESNKSGNESSRYGNASNRPFYDTEPMAVVPNNVDYNVFVAEKQHIMKPEFISDTYVMEKDDSNVTLNSSDMSHNGGKVDHGALGEGVNDHIHTFLEIWELFKIKDVDGDAYKLRVFPFTLMSTAKEWLKSNAPGIFEEDLLDTNFIGGEDMNMSNEEVLEELGYLIENDPSSRSNKEDQIKSCT
ncbi:hypothetical protein Tco_1121286 [Tanacetum coccineum]|uniref:Uncharacterized protein n=1 Tax=Tanacetum coccineum TaxID=301880 RepID=A0ABQ5IX94_9ASTR